jgi:hypothetical protein
LVSNRYIQSLRLKKKLNWKYVGPGTIIAQIGLSAFRVEVPRLNSVYLVFYALLLEPFTQKGSILHPLTPIIDTLRNYSDNVYKVEEIVERRKIQDN